MQFVMDVGRMDEAAAREFISRRYMLLCVNEGVPKAVRHWLATQAPGERYDGE